MRARWWPGLALFALAGCQPAVSDVPQPEPSPRVCAVTSAPSPVMPDGLVAYDRAAGYAIVVSQRSGVDQPADLGTWKWSCTWSRLTGPDGAPAGYAMAYDPELRMTVLIGQKTMGWDGHAWRDLHATPPLNMGSTSLTYDGARKVLVLVDSVPSGLNTWTFDGHRWSKVTTSGPPDSASAAIAYDPRTRSLVAFGGAGYDIFGKEGGTWRWEGRDWIRLEPETSPPAGMAAMAYDEATSQMILLTRGGETWTWDGSAWSRLDQYGPSFTTPGGMVYDAAGRQLIVWQTWKFWPRSQTWTYDGNWSQLP